MRRALVVIDSTLCMILAVLCHHEGWNVCALVSLACGVIEWLAALSVED